MCKCMHVHACAPQSLDALAPCTALKELAVAGNALGRGNGLRCVLVVGVTRWQAETTSCPLVHVQAPAA